MNLETDRNRMIPFLLLSRAMRSSGIPLCVCEKVNAETYRKDKRIIRVKGLSERTDGAERLRRRDCWKQTVTALVTTSKETGGPLSYPFFWYAG